MELTSREITGKTILSGSDEFTVNSSQTLKIETSPEGEELLNQGPAAGKTWTARVAVEIEEVNT